MAFPRRHQLKMSVFVAMLQVYTVTFHHADVVLTMSVLLTSSLFLLWWFSFSKVSLITFGIFALSGFIAEAIAVYGGAWIYAEQHVLSLPLWLPLVWGSVGVASIRLVEKLNERYGN